MILHANVFDSDISYEFIQITIVFPFLIVTYFDDTLYYFVLYSMYSNKLRDSDKRESEYQNVLGRVTDGMRKEKGTKKDGGRERIGCGRENEREWHLHWLTAKSHLIKMSERRLETSQGNTVWMSSLEEPFLRDSAWVTREPHDCLDIFRRCIRRRYGEENATNARQMRESSLILM